METGKKKDALTELVDLAGSQPDQPSNNGTVSTPTGEKVELGSDAWIKKTAKHIVDLINLNKLRKQQKKEAMEQIVKEHYERKKTN